MEEKNINTLNWMLNKKLSKKGHITNPSNGSCCFIDIKDGTIIKTVLVYVSTSYGGCFKARYYINEELPQSELTEVDNKHFKTPLEAYNFIMERTNKINNFFNGLK